MKRLLTAAIGGSLSLAAIFLLPDVWFFLFCVVVVELAVVEFIRIGRSWTPHAPLHVLALVVPSAAAILCFAEPQSSTGIHLLILGVGLLLSTVVAAVVLVSRIPMEQSLVAVGLLAFGVAYFVLPVLSLHRLQRLDPWILLLLLAIVWVGDSAAYYIGTALGRHKLAPVVSPSKSWEGAVAGFLAGLVAAWVWSLWRLGRVEIPVLGLAAVSAVAAQLGDLVESMIKRGAGRKDSGGLLPGHGGVLDRLDALLVAAPVFYFCLLLMEPGRLTG